MPEKENTENVSLKASRCLISIDGPDGVGKGGFVDQLTNTITKIYGSQHVISTSGTRFEACSQSQVLSEELKRTSSPIERNGLYLRSTEIIFSETVIPALEAGQIVILDSSDLRHLAFVTAVYGKNSPVWQKTLQEINKGKLTHRLQPGIRIILTAQPAELLLNLQERSFIDEGDPTKIEEVRKRIQAYEETIKFFKTLPIIGDVKWINVKNSRVSPEGVKKHLNQLIKKTVIPEITPFLSRHLNPLPEKPL